MLWPWFPRHALRRFGVSFAIALFYAWVLLCDARGVYNMDVDSRLAKSEGILRSGEKECLHMPPGRENKNNKNQGRPNLLVLIAGKADLSLSLPSLFRQ